VEKKIVYFEKPGPSNTEQTLDLAIAEARARGLTRILLASTRGVTAQLAAHKVAHTDISLIVVPHQFGFSESQRFPAELVTQLQAQGHRVHFGTMLFHTEGFHGSGAPEGMAMVLRTICQGLKVVVEIVLMAADAGLVAQGEEVIVVTGTGRGADTAAVALASTSNRLHDLHITEILCKPLVTRSWARGTTPYDSPRRPASPGTPSNTGIPGSTTGQ
jgi:hypothetical protein